MEKMIHASRVSLRCILLFACLVMLTAVAHALNPSLIWAKNAGAPVHNDVATGVVALPDGGAAIAGYFQGTMVFSPTLSRASFGK